jgi:enamidase
MDETATDTLRTVIHGLAGVATGDIAAPFVDAAVVEIVGSFVRHVGNPGDVDLDGADVLVDATDLIAIPGLIDPHVHPMIGDWNPRQMVLGWMEAAFHGGVTSMVSQGVVHLPNQPADVASAKALAILGTSIWRHHRPGGGLKMHSGALMLQPGLQRADIEECAEAGVKLIAEVGGGGLWEYEAARPMIEWAQAAGMVVPLHFGAPSYPGSVGFGADEAVSYGADVLVHMNGGSTARPIHEARRALEETSAFAEVVHCGNIRAAVEIVETVVDRGQLDRLIIGSDTPVGHGSIPLAIIKTCSQLGSLTSAGAPELIAAATGNSARAYRLDEVGLVRPGMRADVLLVDRPTGSEANDGLETLKVGDVPAVTTMIVDGRIVAERARNTPLTDRMPSIELAPTLRRN